MKDFSVNFPDATLVRFNIEGVTISPSIQTIGWAFLSENENQNIILRVFLIKKESEELAFELSGELSAFIFPTRIEMESFQKSLIHMSALEYMSILNISSSINLH